MARKSYIELNLYGFDDLLKKIESAGGSINGAVDRCMKKSAEIQETHLREQMRKSDVEADLINRMPPPVIQWSGNACTARVGYKKGEYNPKNLSDGYKVVFINYGTPKITPRNFIKRAKSKAKPQIKKEQEVTLKEILEGLK